MKLLFIPFLQLTILLSLPNSAAANNPGKDFLITLNGSKLTGNILDINLSGDEFEISFENDLGSILSVHPATIYGFAYEDKGETSLYESKYLNGEWQFLKVQKKGAALSLYTSSERQLKFTRSNESPIIVKEKNPQVWLQFAGEKPFKIYRLNYKGLLRKRMKDYPDLAKRIGKRGFRYKDLDMIVELYNKIHDKD